MTVSESTVRKLVREELLRELDYSTIDFNRTGSQEPADRRLYVKDSDRAREVLDRARADYHSAFRTADGRHVVAFVYDDTRDRARQILRDQGLLAETQIHEENPYTGFEDLPPGWDQDSLESFARSLTGQTKDDTEGFFTKCVEKMEDEDGFDNPEAFCASLKDQYLGREDWRGED
jgi:hypothetical protein